MGDIVNGTLLCVALPSLICVHAECQFYLYRSENNNNSSRSSSIFPCFKLRIRIVHHLFIYFIFISFSLLFFCFTLRVQLCLLRKKRRESSSSSRSVSDVFSLLEEEENEEKERENITSTWGFSGWLWLWKIILSHRNDPRKSLFVFHPNSSWFDFFFFCIYRLIRVMDYRIAVWVDAISENVISRLLLLCAQCHSSLSCSYSNWCFCLPHTLQSRNFHWKE